MGSFWLVIGLIVAFLFWIALAGIDIALGIVGLIPVIGDAFSVVGESVSELLQFVTTIIIAILTYMLGIGGKS